MPEHFH